MISKGELSFLHRAMISMALSPRSSISVKSTSAPPESERREASKVEGPYIYSTEQGVEELVQCGGQTVQKDAVCIADHESNHSSHHQSRFWEAPDNDTIIFLWSCRVKDEAFGSVEK